MLESYINNWHRIHKQSTKIMAVAPNDQYDWKPSETAMTLGALLNHLWLAEAGLVEAAFSGTFPTEHPAPLTDTAEMIAAFDQSHAAAAERVATMTAEQLAEEIAPFGPERSMTRMTLLHAMHEHEIHHRGQLYVYLRTLGCTIPPLFG